MKRLTLFVLASSLVACAIPEEDFPDTYAKVLCKRLKECHTADYEDAYGDDHEACREDGAEGADTILDLGDLIGEEYDPAKGRDCINEMKTADCGDLDNVDCDVWSDE